MGQIDFGLLGKAYDLCRTIHRILRSAPPPVCPLSNATILRASGPDGTGDYPPPGSQGHRTSPAQPAGPRLLLNSLFSTQELRGLEGHTESKAVEPVRPIPQVQDALPQVHLSGGETGRLSPIGRPPGSLPARACSPRSPPVPEVRVRGPTLPISRDAIRALIGPPHLYQASSGGGSQAPSCPDPSALLSGRHPGTVVHDRPGHQRHEDGNEGLPGSWLHHKLRKESSSAHYQAASSGGSDRFNKRPGIPITGQSPEHSNHNTADPDEEESSSAPPFLPSREDGILLRHRTVGTQTLETSAVVPAPLPTSGKGQLQTGSTPHPPGSQVPQVVDIALATQGLHLPRARPDDSHHRRKPSRVGSPSPQPSGTGPVVAKRTAVQHQSPGAPGNQAGTARLPKDGARASHLDPDRQHLGQGARQQRGGHKVPYPDEGGRRDAQLGGETPPLDQGRSHFGGNQRHGGLAQPGNDRSGGMAAPSPTVSRTHRSLRKTGGGSLRNPGQCSDSPLCVSLPDTTSGGPRCAALQVARRSPVRIPTSPAAPAPHTKTTGRKSRPTSGSPELAPEAMVCRPSGAFRGPAVGDPSTAARSMPGGGHASRATVAPISRLAFERVILKKDNLPDEVVTTIQAARRPSTARIYEASWQAFCRWSAPQHIDPTSAAIRDILQFLQAGLDKGLAPATLRRQTAALSTVIACAPYQSLAHHPLIKGFLHGATNLRPPTVHRYPSWDLPLVLRALTDSPFEPLDSTALKYLSFKVTFLLAITSARRVSEIAALSVRKDLCIFRDSTVTLRLDPAFIPKVNSWFHRAQELILPDFCPSPRDPREKRWHTLDVRRAIRIYIRRTEPFRRTEGLLVSFNPKSMGHKISAATVSRWIKACIAMAYDLNSRPTPAKISPHSTRSAATSAAWATQASVVDICRAATWSSLTPFIRHYKIDEYNSAEASFGRRVLQRVLSDEDSGGSQLPTQGV